MLVRKCYFFFHCKQVMLTFLFPFQVKMSGCPVCGKQVRALSQHLSSRHRVRNVQERRILLNMSSARVNIRSSPCPATGCGYALSRLQRHIRHTHTELTLEERASLLLRAKWIKSTQLLSSLRATSPTTPMATSIDLLPDDREDVLPSPPLSCGNPLCMETRKGYIQNISQLCEQRDDLLTENGNLRLKLQALQRPRCGSRIIDVPPPTEQEEATAATEESAEEVTLTLTPLGEKPALKRDVEQTPQQMKKAKSSNRGRYYSLVPLS
ncbi:uncharacterized protein LOC115005040 [Cottoperca gobio]|uniref:Uncharacterized protein LOC115005040 n=1 Tax=Cottoperca gobio TaxID=56716 RepID=A0A6J2PBM0_COTGO|nr:uncharacterized protein LOC115005040 [Cottoperca gobio]